MSKVSQKDIARVIRSLSVDMSSTRLSKVLASYLARERRTGELDAILREVSRQREVEDGVLEVDLTSAFPLNEGNKRELTKSVDAKKVVVNETIDKNVIGGVRMETSISVLDLTVRNRLQKLKQGVIKEA